MTIGRAVVTGGGGFLGSHLCEHLLARGVAVACLDSFLTGTPSNVEHLLADPLFTLRDCDAGGSYDVAGPVDLAQPRRS